MCIYMFGYLSRVVPVAMGDLIKREKVSTNHKGPRYSHLRSWDSAKNVA
jgi:hypothetical protein